MYITNNCNTFFCLCSPLTVEPVGTFSAAVDFDIAFEYQHLEYSRAETQMQQTEVPFLILPNVLPFELPIKFV